MIPNNEVYKILRKHLETKVPFSLVRIGDGEGRFLANDPGGIKSSMINQFGSISGDPKIIINDLIYACKNADILGVPTDRHMKINRSWRSARRIGSSLNSNICSIDIHYEFLNNGYYIELLNEIDELYYISGRNLTNIFKTKYGIKLVHEVIITPEMKWEANRKQVPHFPNQYLKIKNWMNSQTCNGKLCLVGAGVAGKIYCQWFKEHGGVAMDIGSIFDSWAGLVTRGKTKGIGVKSKINTL